MAPPKRQRRTQALDNLGTPTDGYVLTGDSDAEAGMAWASVAPARQTWAAAGGSSPAFGAVDLGGGATAPTLGTGAQVWSSFNRIGVECFASCRIIAGTGAAGATGAVTLTGLPVTPVNLARPIGYGFIIDSSDTYAKYPIQVVWDPVFSTTAPMLFLDDYQRTADGIPVSTVPHFSALEPLVAGSSPFEWDDSCIVNVSLQYEAA